MIKLTKNKESDLHYNLKRLIEERKLVDRKVTDELNHFPTSRSEALLLTNYVENIVKDFIEVILESHKAREIGKNTIVDILLEKNIISYELAQDIKKIFDIRNQYGHTMRLLLIDERVETLIEKMEITKKLKEKGKWEEYDVDEKILTIAFHIIGMLQDIFDVLKNRHVNKYLIKDDK